MRIRNTLTWIALWSCAAALAGCEVRCSTANIPSAVLAKDENATQPTTVFGQGDVFWCVVTLANAMDDTSVKTVWTAVKAEGLDPNYEFGENEQTTGSTVIQFHLAAKEGAIWPVGDYKVDLYLDGKLNRTLPFKVRAAPPGQVAIGSATLCKTEEGAQPTLVFAPADAFYCAVFLVNAPDDTKVKAVWTAIDVGDAASANTQIDTAELTHGAGKVQFSLTKSEGAWPPGEYKVDLYLNDVLRKTLNFQVKADPA